jgi:hypothetical protein
MMQTPRQSSVKPLPTNLSLSDARKDRAVFLEALSDADWEIIQWLTNDRYSLFGSMGGGAGVFGIRSSKRTLKNDMRRDDKASTKAVRLVKLGWLRLATGPDGDNGYFWLTGSAEQVLKSLDEKEGRSLLVNRFGPSASRVASRLLDAARVSPADKKATAVLRAYVERYHQLGLKAVHPTLVTSWHGSAAIGGWPVNDMLSEKALAWFTSEDAARLAINTLDREARAKGVPFR